MDMEEELDRVMDSIDRFNQMEEDEFDKNEYDLLLKRYEELRMAGAGPQPYWGSNNPAT